MTRIREEEESGADTLQTIHKFTIHTKPHAIMYIIHINLKIAISDTYITNFKAILFSLIRQLYSIFQHKYCTTLIHIMHNYNK